jgi:hypothetical protein
VPHWFTRPGDRADSRACVLLCLALGCRPGASTHEPGPALPIVERDGPIGAPPFAGTWVGPELTLSFVGPWVLIRPSGGPQQAPIELRATIERAAGDAYALETSLADVLVADFLRAPDWTLLIEDGQLAIAMGDEPLTAYVAQPDASSMLHGPSMLDELELPTELVMADAIACLELAGDRCAALESDGPIAAGCRELQWATCIAWLGPPPVDPVARSAWTSARNIHQHTLTLRFCVALLAAAREHERAAAQALHARARANAEQMLDSLRLDGPLPESDPHLAELLALLH